MKNKPASTPPKPLVGMRGVEFTQMVMGAKGIKVEPVEGDRTRRQLGAGPAYFRCSTTTRKA